MLNALVKPSDIIEREPWDILMFLHSQDNVSKISLKLQLYMITCFYCKTVVCPEDFSVVAKRSWIFKTEIQENILIKLLKPAPLYLF